MAGIATIVKDFVANHSEISKRQCEIKINEIAEKEKRPGDSRQVWHIKPEFESLLGGAGTKDAPESSQKKKSTPGEKRKREEEKTPPVTPAAKKKAVVPSTSASFSGEKTPVAVSADGLVPPKKYKRAFGHFVRVKRAEVEELLKHEPMPEGTDEVLLCGVDVECGCYTCSLLYRRISSRTGWWRCGVSWMTPPDTHSKLWKRETSNGMCFL